MKRSLLALASAVLLGCSTCPPPISTDSARGDPITLDATTPEAGYQLSIHAPEQSCGCTWCGNPTLSLSLSGELTWSSPDDTDAHAVVRVTLTPKFKPSASDSIDPPLPLDVVLTKASTRKPLLAATHVCPEDEPCDPSYTLTLSRLESAPPGTVTATWSVDVDYTSKPDGSLRVSLTR